MIDAADALHDLVREDEDSSISPRALLVALMAEWGGPAGVAKELRLDFEACEPGSTSRIRIGTDLVGAVMKFGDEDGEGEEDAESVEAKLKELIQKADDSGE
jgi:hypothetical protein